MLAFFLESLPAGWPAGIACITGFAAGLLPQLKRTGLIGLTFLLVSFGLIVAGLMAAPFLIKAFWEDCRTPGGHEAMGAHIYLTIGLTWLSAFGAGMLSVRLWKISRPGGGLLAIASVLAAMPYSYLWIFAVGFRPGCYV